jgi:hypothetical protein
MNPQLDQDVVRLAKAIRYTESRDNEQAKGASGEFGLYQFTEPTWASTTKKYGLDPNDRSRANQNKAAYTQLKELKDQGYKPSQIAAFWNSGKLEGWEDNRGVNKHGVRFDTPEYVQKVGSVYQGLKTQNQPLSVTTPSTAGAAIPGLPPPPQGPEHQAPVTAPENPEQQDGILASIVKDPLETLLVKPAARFAEAVGRTGILGQNIKKGYEEMADTGEGQTFFKDFMGGINVEQQKAFGEGGAKQIAGEALKAGSYLYSGGKAPEIIGKGFKGAILPMITQGAKVGAIGGAAYGSGQALTEDQSLGDVAKEGLIGGGFGGVAGGLLGGVGAAGVGLLRRKDVVQDIIKKDVNELLNNGRAMTNATQNMVQRNVPIDEILSDPEVFRGLQVKDGNIDPEDAIALVDERIDAYMDAKSRLLPEMDRVTMPVSRETVRQEAKNALRGKFTPADETAIMKSLDDQIDALPENMTLSELDKMRARFRESARNARGLQKSNSEYTALENATRDVLFRATDNLPFDTNKEFPALNNEIKNLIGAREFMDKTLRGRKAPGSGWAREALARIVGGTIGAAHSPIGAFLGQHVSGQIQHIIMNKKLGSSLKMKLIKGITKDKKVLREAEALLKKTQGYDPLKERLALPAPAIRLPAAQGKSGIDVYPAAKGEPGRTPKGKEGAGKFFRTYLSSGKTRKEGLVNRNLATAPIGGVAGANEDGTVDPTKASIGMAVVAALSGKAPRLTPEMKSNIVRILDDFYTRGAKDLDLQQDAARMAEDMGVKMPKTYSALVKKLESMLAESENYVVNKKKVSGKEGLIERAPKTNPLYEDAKRYKNAEDFVRAKRASILSSDAEEKFINTFKSGAEEGRFSGDIWKDAYFKEKVVPYSSLKSKEIGDASRVKYWKDKIRKGDRTPVLVDIVDGKPNIVDGNHKLWAYRALKIDVPIIERIESSQLADIYKKAHKLPVSEKADVFSPELKKRWDEINAKKRAINKSKQK